MTPSITTFRWVPEFARGFVRDLRPRWAFEEEGIPYAVELLDFPTAKSEAYRQRQPFGQVPAYQDDAIDLFESGAIAMHIADKGQVLFPDCPKARARAVQWVIAALNSVEPQVMQHAIFEMFERDKPYAGERKTLVDQHLHGRLADLSHRLGDRSWLDGDSFTVGDLMMVSVLGGLRGTDYLDPYPNLAAYVARGEARPAHVKAMNDQLALYATAEAPPGMA